MARGLLIFAGLLENAWALALKQVDGFTRLWPSLVGVSVAMSSLVLRGIALKHLSAVITYAIWVGIGAFGVTAFGIVFLHEQLSAAKLFFLALI
jgi:quaternary ammonium compound-resistance protein SugE